MYLSSFSMTEPEDHLNLYFPSWLNVWESHIYNKALKSTGAHAWGLKRFGTSVDCYTREMIRTPRYQEYINAMEQVADAALQQLSAKERVLLLKSRTAFIYVDAWGESGTMENISSGLHTATIDTLPRNLLKKFSVTDFTCKTRGEKQSFVQAMKMAEDYLKWDVFDFVVICAAYRAVPILVFSEEDISLSPGSKVKNRELQMNISVERVGCFIFSRRENELALSCGHYLSQTSDRQLFKDLLNKDADVIALSGLRTGEVEQALASSRSWSDCQLVNLVETYGGSGCLTPALSWIYLKQQSLGHGKMRTLVPDNFGGYSWFDTRY